MRGSGRCSCRAGGGIKIRHRHTSAKVRHFGTRNRYFSTSNRFVAVGGAARARRALDFLRRLSADVVSVLVLLYQ